ncbi:MAG: radical SAM protein [Vulcanimicrobiota bacterium]
MRLTLIHPAVGHQGRRPYIRVWQMEPLPPAVLAALTPADVEVRFYDDRLEAIPYAEPTDLVAISVETYTARRAYQIASHYRRRGVPVVMGGFHTTLVPEEVSQYAEAIVVGEAEEVWPELIDDFRHGRLKNRYQSSQRPRLERIRPRREIFAGKGYLKLGLVEAGRGCHFHCEFCAIQAYFKNTQVRRPIDDILADIREHPRPLYFFVDDNITSNLKQAKEFFRALIPLNIRWVSQASINAAHDEEFLQLIRASGCQMLLIGFETLNPTSLKAMNKEFNTMRGGYEQALANLRRHRIRLYPTFIFGYDEDTEETLQQTLDFCRQQRFYLAAFNHLTPFPGTPLYARLQQEGRLLYERWWLDETYRYGMVPFRSRGLAPEQIARLCLRARRSFYGLPSILHRALDFQVNSSSLFGLASFITANLLLRREVVDRQKLPMGDADDHAPLLPVAGGVAL